MPRGASGWLPLPDAPCLANSCWQGGGGVESALRGCVPIPHRAPHIQAGHRVRYFTAAEDAYQQLIAQHVDYAERALIIQRPGVRRPSRWRCTALGTPLSKRSPRWRSVTAAVHAAAPSPRVRVRRRGLFPRPPDFVKGGCGLHGKGPMNLPRLSPAGPGLAGLGR